MVRLRSVNPFSPLTSFVRLIQTMIIHDVWLPFLPSSFQILCSNLITVTHVISPTVSIYSNNDCSCCLLVICNPTFSNPLLPLVLLHSRSEFHCLMRSHDGYRSVRSLRKVSASRSAESTSPGSPSSSTLVS